MVEVVSWLVVRTPTVPKSIVEALLMMHEELTVTCTAKVEVTVVALERSAKAMQDKAAAAKVSFRGQTMDSNVEDMTNPLKLRCERCTAQVMELPRRTLPFAWQLDAPCSDAAGPTGGGLKPI
jgi:hypothetical protein